MPFRDQASTPSTTPHNAFEQPLRGVYSTIDELTGARFAASAWLLRLRQRARSQWSGGLRSTLRGRGLEFEEVRAYQAGDDVRNIDWRVTARSGRAFTKLFREEREKPLLIVVDQRQPMFFGSSHCFKAKLAAQVGALLAWCGLEQGDRIGGLVFGNDTRSEIRPRRARKTALQLLHTLHDYNHRLRRDTRLTDAGTSLLEALTELRRIARPGSAIYLISDFCGIEAPQVREQLHALARHCEVNALFVHDPLESELPAPALYAVSDGAQRRVLDSGDPALRRRHSSAFAAHRERLLQRFGAMNIPVFELSTATPPLHGLALQRALQLRSSSP